MAHADHWRATGDRGFLDPSWDSIVKAWRFTAQTDTDGNGLVENAGFGHGWVEGGDLHPAHEEIYQQAVWIEACRGLAELALVKGERGLAQEARDFGERTRAAVEKTYWLGGDGYYAFATKLPSDTSREAERGPARERRQARLDALAPARVVDEDTVMPALALLFGQLDDGRAQAEIDHLGSGALATDWGARLLSDHSALYDPLSYHHGSVWPLFTGWASMAAYRYGRPHVGYQALMANALLRSRTALGYVTELLSGDFLSAFGRSSHHQVWSEAMVVTPTLAARVRSRSSAFQMRAPRRRGPVQIAETMRVAGRGERRRLKGVGERDWGEQPPPRFHLGFHEGHSRRAAPRSTLPRPRNHAGSRQAL